VVAVADLWSSEKVRYIFGSEQYQRFQRFKSSMEIIL